MPATYGPLLQYYRERAGLNVEEAADRLGIDVATLQRYESNRALPKLYSHVQHHAKIFGLSNAHFLKLLTSHPELQP